jgi:NAD(P)-dependent dehydrogenase (short-subunit alcohol dehydrogenase family)
VTSKDELAALTKEIESKEKYLSLVVAAAGVSGAKGFPDTSDAQQMRENLWKEPIEDWNSTYNSDVTSVFFTTVSFLPLLQTAPHHLTSSVIVISSMSGLMRHSQSHFSYNAAKAATAHLSRMMSKEFAKTGVRVNSIAPGYFPSEMTMKESDERNKARMPDDKVKDKGHEVPAGRAGSDSEMGMGVIFLAKNGYVNGEILKLDGGVMNEVGS